jgi:hypothetical protein
MQVEKSKEDIQICQMCTVNYHSFLSLPLSEEDVSFDFAIACLCITVKRVFILLVLMSGLVPCRERRIQN